MTDVGRNESVRLEDDPRIDTFEGHSAFSRTSPHYIEDGPTVEHSGHHDVTVQTTPVPFDRTNRDDVDRVQHELMVQLAHAVDDHCIRHILERSEVTIEDVRPESVNAWIRRSVRSVRLDTRSGCEVDVTYDVELDTLIQQRVESEAYVFEVGHLHCPLFVMSRNAAWSEPADAVVAKQHVLGLTSRVALHFASFQMGRDEYLGARCDLAYGPRLDLHPRSVRIARVSLGSEEHWRTAVLDGSASSGHDSDTSATGPRGATR